MASMGMFKFYMQSHIKLKSNAELLTVPKPTNSYFNFTQDINLGGKIHLCVDLQVKNRITSL
jgi:hypothetical protein